MIIKLKRISDGEELIFSTDEYHAALQVTEDELSEIHTMAPSADGKSPSGNEYRTIGLIRPADEEEDQLLSAWCRAR